MATPEEQEEQEVMRWRAVRDRNLRRPDGWLSLAGLAWLKENRNRVGSDPAGDVVLPKGPPLIGWIEVAGDGVTFRSEPQAGVLSAGRPVTVLPLQDDRDGTPTTLTVGRLTFHLINREGALAVRIRDPDKHVLRSFGGMEYFPFDPRWRVEAGFESAPPGQTLVAPNVLGTGETYRSPGTVVFEVEGASHRLQGFQEPREADLFIVFGDATNGTETYSGGRYLYAPPPAAGTVVVDFNRAYNPPCVFTPYATCVLPLPANRLPIRIEAGEKAYRGRTVT
jgi:uncharacterized protein (DUF1684 family)